MHTNRMNSSTFKKAFVQEWIAEQYVDEESELPELLYLEATNLLLDTLPEPDQKAFAQVLSSGSDEEASRLFQQYYKAHKSQVDSHIQEVIGDITS